MLLIFGYPTCSADMDDTLYPVSSGINLACRKNIIGMIVDTYDNDDGVNGSNTVTMTRKLIIFFLKKILL